MTSESTNLLHPFLVQFLQKSGVHCQSKRPLHVNLPALFPAPDRDQESSTLYAQILNHPQLPSVEVSFAGGFPNLKRFVESHHTKITIVARPCYQHERAANKLKGSAMSKPHH